MILGLLIGFILAVSSIGGTYYYFGVIKMNQLSAQYESMLADYSNPPSVSAYRLTRDIARDELLKPEDLEMVSLPLNLSHPLLLQDQSQIVNQEAARAIKRGMLVYQDMVYLKSDMPDDLRVIELSQVIMPIQMIPGDDVDVRISFPSGLDYVVLSKKRVQNLLKPGAEGQPADQTLSLMTMHLTSEEILRLSSALVDAYLKEGTYLYATVYVDSEFQAAAQITYPSNEDVQKLMKDDPNVLQKALVALEQQQRQNLNLSLTRIPVNSIRQIPTQQDQPVGWMVETPSNPKSTEDQSLSDLD